MIAWIGGRAVGYDDVGEGDVVLFLHGFPHRRSLWTSQLSALRDRARCVAMDLAGFGESAGEEVYSIDRYADDAAEFLDYLRIDRAVVCGLSMGGYVALSMIRRHARRVRGLVLMDTRAAGDSPATIEKRREMMRLARDRGAESVADVMIVGMIGKSTRAKCPEVVDMMHGMLSSAPVAGITGALEAMLSRPDATPTLQEIVVPTLVVVGEEDVLTPVHEAEFLHQNIRGSRLEIVSGAGHVPNVERSAAVNHLLSEFVASVVLS